MAGGVIVTGAKGFVGKALVREIATRYPKIDVWQLDLPENDLRKQQTLDAVHDYQPFVLFHLAAHHFIPWCNKHPRETLELNAIATTGLLEAAGASKVILASSAAVYGLTDDPHRLFIESDTCLPDDVYGMSKMWAEIALHRYAYREHVGAVAARLFNVVGPAGADGVPHLHPKVMAAAGGTITANVPALQEHRDYVHVDDVAHSLVDLAERIVRPGFDAINVCSGVSLSGDEMCRLYDVEAVDDASLRRPTGGHLRGSNARLLAMTDWAPTSPWERLLSDGVVRA